MDWATGGAMVCTSCRQLVPDDQNCACLIDRAEVVAEEGYELHRVTVPRWRRPRPWDQLPERARQDLVAAGLDLVRALEGAGWRLQVIGAEPDHGWPADQEPEPFDPALLPVVPRYYLEPERWHPQQPGPLPVRDPRERLTDPPMIQGVTLRDWLVHHHPARDHVWADVVREMYETAAETPAVASYFHEVILRDGGLEILQRHFTAALVMVTHQGLTRGTVDRMRERHAHVRNAARQPISGAIYDAVVGVLVGILRRYEVPESGISQLAVTISPLRPAIVADQDATDPGGYPAFGAPGGVQ